MHAREKEAGEEYCSDGREVPAEIPLNEAAKQDFLAGSSDEKGYDDEPAEHREGGVFGGLDRSRVLCGWSVEKREEGREYVFCDNHHENAAEYPAGVAVGRTTEAEACGEEVRFPVEETTDKDRVSEFTKRGGSEEACRL